MIKRKLRLWIVILGIIISSSIFHLPSRGMAFLAQRFVRSKYNVSLGWKSFKGGFGRGISLEGVSVSNENCISLQCPQVSSNIRFKDFIFHKDDFPYGISLDKPVISIENTSFFQTARPLGNKFKMLVSEAQLSIQDPSGLIAMELNDFSGSVIKDRESLTISFIGPDNLTGLNGEINLALREGSLEIVNGEVKFSQADFPSIWINGGILLDKKSMKIEGGLVSLGELELGVGGAIFADRRLNLEIDAGAAEESPRFLVMGSLDEPQIFTNWGVIETMFRIGGTRYSNGRLIFPRVSGEIKLPGFIPFGLEGGLELGMGDIGFKNIKLANVLNIDGEISRYRESRLKLWVEDTKGGELADQLPEALRPLISSHMINAQLSVYGGIDDLQCGGILRLFSNPMEIVCRYRHNRFSFSSIDRGPFKISGSINLDTEPNVKIRGYFHKMDFLDLMLLFTEDIGSDWRGVIDGEFEISGELNDPLIQAKLEIKEGQIGDIKFDVAYLNLEGTKEALNFKHSMVYYKEIPTELTGYVDPKRKDLFAHIDVIHAGNSFIWKGLNIIKDSKDRTVIFGQDVNENVSVQIKAPSSSDPEDGIKDNEPEVKVEYKLFGNKNLLIKMEEDEETVGIEHKVKF